jgi:hypothetical protein
MRYLPAIFALAFSGVAFGQAGDFWFNYGRSFLSNAELGNSAPFGPPAVASLDDGYRFGFRFNFNLGDHFGGEFGYAYNHTNLVVSGTSTGMHFHQPEFSGLYYLTSDKSRVRPFGVAGIVIDTFVRPGGAVNYGSQTKFGASFGGGVKVHVKGIWGVRFDVREYVSGKPDFNIFTGASGPLWQTEVSGGVGIGF